MTDMTRKCSETDIDIDTIETIESLATQLSHEEFILLCNRKRPTRQTEKKARRRSRASASTSPARDASLHATGAASRSTATDAARNAANSSRSSSNPAEKSRPCEWKETRKL